MEKTLWKTSIKPLHSLRGQGRLKPEHLIAPESGLQHYTQAGFRIHNYNYEGKVSATSLGDTALGFLKARIADVISFSIAPITFDVRHLQPFNIISPLTPRPNIVILLGNLPIGDIFLTENETGFFTKTTEYIAWHCFSADLIRIVGNRYGSEPIKKFSIASAHFDYLDYVQTDEFQLDCALKFQYELEAHDIVNFLIDD